MMSRPIATYFRPVAAALAAALTLVAASYAADLVIGEGVVVKSGASAGIVVRDAIHAKGAIFTSIKDDSASNQTGTTAQTPAKGDWNGIKIEASVAAGNAVLNSASVRYAGANNAAGVELRKLSPSVSSLLVSDSITGIRIIGAATPSFTGLSLVNNTVGLELLSNANPSVSNADIRGNSSFGISNLTPSTVIQATGNWWGNASGPKNSLGNPSGTGDAVSAGVNYANWLGALPLIDPRIAASNGNYYTDQAQVQFDLSCRNASEYRIAENGNFSGAFLPLTATVNYTLSAGDGVKNISVQYRGPGGIISTATLPQGLLFDTSGPTLTVTNPADGSFITKAISIDATATDPAGVTKVEFYVDNALAATDTTVPYSYAWDATLVADGSHSIRVIAFDAVGHSSSATRTVSKGIAPPDSTGPSLSNFKFGASTLANGVTITKTGSISASASDPSGVARIDFLLDGVVFGSNSSGTYSANLDLGTVSDGAHTLSLSGYDSLNNRSQNSFNIVVALAAPSAPSLTRPATGLITNQPQQTVTGSAERQTQIQLYRNGLALGSPVAADNNGNFSLPVTLSNGANQIQAAALNRAGSSTLSNSLSVTVDASIPGTPSGLTAAAQLAGRIKLSWLAVNDTAVTGYDLYRSQVAFTGIVEATKANLSRITTASFDDLPPTDGVYYYRVVAINSLNTPSQPSNQSSAVADATLPRATSIVYAPSGKLDPVTGRIGQGRVNLTVNVSEPLLVAPFVSIAPQNGAAIAATLTRVTDTQYQGYFDITANTLSGTAYAIFSARDLIGNRGTEIGSGLSIEIDAEGPTLTGISVTPSDPIKNDTPATLSANFTLSEAMKPGQLPQLSYLLSKAGRSAVPLSVSQTGTLTYQASFTLPSDAGAGSVESLQFIYSGVDNLDNVATRITANNRLQVYQGALPPSGIPLNFAGQALPGGRVKLTWRPVDDVVGYQLYRQAPNEATLSALLRVTGTDSTDATPQDGTYRYSVASIRQHNGQESLSSQSQIAEVKADASRPDAPSNLSLSLVGQGLQAVWSAPLATDVISYNVYRSSPLIITDITGLLPLRTGIKQLGYVDPSPSLTDHSYVATAVDAAGNESPISNSGYLNFVLLPVATISIVQTDAALPVITWTHSNASINSYDFYVGENSTKLKLNASPLSVKTYTDSGYANNERLYTVVAIDSNNVQVGRSLLLPKLSAQIVAGTPIKRGLLNRLQYQVTNGGANSANNIALKVVLGGKTHTSQSFSLAGGETKTIPVIVGGYSTLSNFAPIVTTLESTPNVGEKIDLVRNGSVDVIDGSLTLSLITDTLTRGGNGQVRFEIDNTSDVDIEVLTATNTGRNASSEMRLKLIDADNNVLATQAVQQFVGNVVTLASGQTVARIPAGSRFTSDPLNITVPSSSPNNVQVQLEIDQLHFHLGQADQVDIPGMSTRKAATLVDTRYAGTVTSISPTASFGDKNIVINGQAIDRQSRQALGNVPLRLVFSVNGFERRFDLYTDTSGNYSYTFKPQATDAGVFKVSVVHPDLLERPSQGQFVLNRVSVSPAQINLNIPRNFTQNINIQAIAGDGTAATNVRLVYEAQYQPIGSLPTGVTVTTSNPSGAPVNLASKQTLNLPVNITANNSANETGTLILTAFSDEQGTTPIGSISINYRFSDARASLTPSPSFVETGVAQGGAAAEQVTLENKGLASASGVTATLLNADGSPAPAWIYLTSPASIGEVKVGDKKLIDITATPDASVANGIYTFKLRIAASNSTGGDVNVFVSVTQSGVGNALFKAADIYTGTLDKTGKRVPGLANARIVVQNEAVASVTQTINTDAQGEAFFTGLPSGSYKYRATANNHEEVAGRFNIKPGVTASADIFLNYNLVTVEWSVREITIQDRYEITLTSTFETDVPAAVVVVQPTSVNLPKLKPGDVFLGEFTLTNYGLVRADNVKPQLPPSDQYVRYEFLVDIPASLDAKQRITLPYRAISLKSFEPDGSATGGGCYDYSNRIFIPYDYVCANGTIANGSAGGYWYYTSGTACPGGGGGGAPSTSIGGGGVGGGFPGGGPGYDSLPGAACIPNCPNCCPVGNK